MKMKNSQLMGSGDRGRSQLFAANPVNEVPRRLWEKKIININ
jgi:hypothetical protein